MPPLVPRDAAWLLLESAVRPLHVGGPLLFTPPPDAPPTWIADTVRAALRHRQVCPPLDRSLRHPHRPLSSWGLADVDLTYHVRHLALPRPGRIRELLSLVSRLHATLLDRHRPLWELHLVEGLADGRVALNAKFHLALFDQVQAMRQVLAGLSPDPDARDLVPPWAVPAQPEEAAGWGDPLRAALRGLLGRPAAGAGALRALAAQVLEAARSEVVARPFQAPPSMLNAPLTAARRVVAQSYELARVDAVAAAAGVQRDEVWLAMCGGALRTYLRDHRVLPSRSLVALVPVDLRGSDQAVDSRPLLPVALATDVADPLRRLEVVAASLEAGRARLRAMTPAERSAFRTALVAPLVAGQLAGLGRVLPPLCNVVISHVPGPEQVLHWNGARLDGFYPTSFLFDGYALAITQTTYAGSLEVGITADRSRVPNAQRLIHRLEDALAALERATGA